MHREHWVTAGGRPVRSLVAGGAGADRPHVVLVPGLGAVGYLVNLLHASAAEAPTGLLDLPGFGHRRTAGLPVGLDHLAVVMVEALPAGPVVLLGHSTGALLALRAAVLAPQHVAAVVLLGPAFEPDARRPAALLARIARAALVESPRLLPRTVPDYVRGGRRFLEFVRAALHDRPEDLIGSVRCPVLVARGGQDPICSAAWSRRLAEAAPDGRAYTLPGAHNVPFTHPSAVVSVLREASDMPSVHPTSSATGASWRVLAASSAT